MPVRRLWVRQYRSLLDVDVVLGAVTVVVGENGTGKSNLYRSLRLLSCAADGRLARTLLEDGGLASARWAGTRRARGKSVRVTVGIQLDDWCWELALGLPEPMSRGLREMFALDPEVKEERVWLADRPRAPVIDRSLATALVDDVHGERVVFNTVLDKAESVLAQLGEPQRFPEAFSVRERVKRFRFYHHIPTDPGAASRHAQPGVRTYALAEDGSDLAAALATIADMGSRPALDEAIDAAFPGSVLGIDADHGVFDVYLERPGLVRPLAATEWSDGTLRYLCLLAALLSPRPPELLVLNEPENSLHADLLEPLARLIAESSRHGQIWVTTHSGVLADALARHCGCEPYRLTLVDGETRIN